jgi:DNA-binding MarR family transcriptional regulator
MQRDKMTKAREQETSLALWSAILRASMTVGQEMRQLFAEWNLTGAQWNVMMALGRAGPEGIMLSEIGQLVFVSGGNVTGIMDRLEEAGYATRSIHPDDRRAVLACLTEKGRELYEQFAPLHRERVTALLAGLGPEERVAAAAMLARVSDYALTVRRSDAADVLA